MPLQVPVYRGRYISVIIFSFLKPFHTILPVLMLADAALRKSMISLFNRYYSQL